MIRGSWHGSRAYRPAGTTMKERTMLSLTLLPGVLFAELTLLKSSG